MGTLEMGKTSKYYEDNELLGGGGCVDDTRLRRKCEAKDAEDNGCQ